MLKTASSPKRSTSEEVSDDKDGDGVNDDGVEIAKKSGKSKD